jgi:hypothetical protein
MKREKSTSGSLEDFVSGKTASSVALLHYFIEQFSKVGRVQAIPAKTMIGIATERKRIAYVTQIGRDFVHVVFPFTRAYDDNLCFEKIAQVPGDVRQFNHHLRLKRTEDINEEVRAFMKMAYEQGS